MATEQAIKQVRDAIDKQLVLPYRDKPANSYNYNIPSSIVVKELYDICDLPSAFRGLELATVATISLISVNKPGVQISLLERSLKLRNPKYWRVVEVYLSSQNRERSDCFAHRLMLQRGQQPILTSRLELGDRRLGLGKVDMEEQPSDLVLQAFTSIIEQTGNFKDY